MQIEPLVSADWLLQHLQEVVVLDGSYYLSTMGRDADEEFAKGHIPAAQRWNIDEIADTTSDLKHMMPTPQAVAVAAGKRGISCDSTVVVYDQLGMFSAARVWLTLKSIGHQKLALLDGGLPCWHGDIETGASKTVAMVEYGHIEPQVTTVDRTIVGEALQRDNTSVLDARSAARFNAQAPEPVAGLRAGHMPGALSVPYDQLLDENNRFKTTQELREVFSSHGVKLEDQLITSCGSGVTASIITFALALLGAESKVYDGSWSEWGRPELDLPIV